MIIHHLSLAPVIRPTNLPETHTPYHTIPDWQHTSSSDLLRKLDLGAFSATNEAIFKQLPDSKRDGNADFARFLLARQDDERWERLIASPERRPKLDEFLRNSAVEPETPLDPSRL